MAGQSPNRFALLDILPEDGNETPIPPPLPVFNTKARKFPPRPPKDTPLRPVSGRLAAATRNNERSMQGPVPSRPYAKLCAICASIFTSEASESIGQWVSHHGDVKALQDAAIAGCMLCTRLSKQYLEIQSSADSQNEENAHHDSPTILYRIQDEVYQIGLEFGYRQQSSYLRRSAESILELQLLRTEEVEPLLPHFPMSSSTRSSKTLELCRYWLNSCRSNHNDCGPHNINHMYRPSRLIYVYRDDDEVIRARLDCNPDMRKNRSYLTLSHCWGTNRFFMLEKSNIAWLQRDIPITKLQTAFQDALFMTLELGYHYIWIDSLCIMQDSRKDWVREASRMGQTYKYSTCNIAATGFSNGHQGLFVDRDPENFTYPRIHADWSGTWWDDKLRKSDYFLADGNLWYSEVSSAPLNKRGWVLQERLLSPCIMHFGQRQVFWECSELEGCELFPEGLPDEMIGESGFKSINFYKTRSPEQLMNMFRETVIDVDDDPYTIRSEIQSIYSSWHNIVQAYSFGDLTRPEDKLVALAGAAKEVRHITGDRYVAGLWERNLLRDILWRLDEHEREPSARKLSVRLPSVFRAPSWSWASIDGRISYINASRGGECPEVLHSTVLQVDTALKTEDDTSLVCGGHLRLKGPLFKAFMDSKRLRSVYPYNWRISNKSVHVRVTFDFPLSPTAEDGIAFRLKQADNGSLDLSIGKNFQKIMLVDKVFYFLLIRTDGDVETDEPNDYGLVLSPTGARRGEYIRVGSFQAEQDMTNGVFMQQTDKLPLNAYEEVEDNGQLMLYTVNII